MPLVRTPTLAAPRRHAPTLAAAPLLAAAPPRTDLSGADDEDPGREVTGQAHPFA